MSRRAGSRVRAANIASAARSLQLAAELKELATQLGLATLGITSAAPFEEARRTIEERAAAGLTAGLGFALSDPARSTEPRATLPNARSIVVAAMAYWRPDPGGSPQLAGLVSRHAWAPWYDVLEAKLRALAGLVERSGYRTVTVADDSRLVDRAAAERAGVGHYGKNACIITESAGSWVLLGSIITDAPIATDEPAPGDCGDCTICISACPTGAIVAPGVIDARRCLPRLFQGTGPISAGLRTSAGARVYGCDACQEVCPLNKKALRRARRLSAVAHEEGHVCGEEDESPALIPRLDLADMLTWGDDHLLRVLGHFYVPRRNPRYIRRNALTALGNSSDPAAADAVSVWLESQDPLLRAHAAWALGSLGGAAARGLLEDTAGREQDPGVIAEIDAALGRQTCDPGPRKPAPSR